MTMGEGKANRSSGHSKLGNEEQENHGTRDPDEMCGIGSFRPAWLQKFADIRVFVASLSIIIFMKNAANLYTVGVARTIEKRYNLNSTQTGIIMSVADILQLSLVVFISYYGDKAHKPRILGIMAIALVISGFICGSINFVFPSKDTFTSHHTGSIAGVDLLDNITYTTLAKDNKTAQICSAPSFVNSSFPEECGDSTKSSLDADTGAYVMFIISQVFLGLGGSGMNALGMSYIHDNAPKGAAFQYFGICSSMFAWGPICGFGVAALTTRWPENLKYSPYSPKDPRFIGCWWLGYYIFSAIMIVFFIPMVLLPRRLPGAAVKRPTEIKKKRQEDQSLIRWFWEQTKEFPKAVCLLFRNSTFICLLIFYVSGCYVMAGVLMNQPRYLENFFYLPAFQASILTGLQGALAAALGIIIGGVMMQKIQPTLHRIAMWIFAISIAVSVLGVIAFMVVCPQRLLGGNINPQTNMLDIQTSCNANCSCINEKFNPVCGDDDKTYYSPCHAGCTSFDVQNKTYSMCNCIEGGAAKSGYCSMTCNSLVPFVVILFVAAFIGGISRVPVIHLQMGIARPDQKAFLLGVTTFVVNLLGLIPAPILYGHLIDSTCIFWRRKSCGRLGACIFYNLTQFRYMIMGVPMLFKPTMLISQFVIILILWRRFRKSGENATSVNNEKGEYIPVQTVAKEEERQLSDLNSNYEKETEENV